MKTLFLTIDFINDIVHPDGKLALGAKFVSDNQVIEKVNKALEEARKKNCLIGHVKVGFNADYREVSPKSPLFSAVKDKEALQLDGWGTKFHKELDVQEDDFVIVKHRVSPLYATNLEVILRAHEVERVILTGVATNIAIESCSRELHDRDYEVIILEDGCGAHTQELHQASIESLKVVAQVDKTVNVGKYL